MKNGVKLAREGLKFTFARKKSVKSAQINNACLMTFRDNIWLVVTVAVVVVVVVATIIKRRDEAIMVELHSVPTNTGNCTLIWSTEKTKANMVQIFMKNFHEMLYYVITMIVWH